MSLSKNDTIFTLGTGLIAGVIAWRIVLFLEIPRFADIPFGWLVPIMPVLWWVLLVISIKLRRMAAGLPQFVRFAIVGVTNSLVDFGYLNLLISSTGIQQGIWFSVFKASSFTVANIGSYLMNKYWAFEAGGNRPHAKEYMRFLGVSVIGLVVNVTVASVVVNGTSPILGASPIVWANIGAIIGSISTLIVNFLGYKYIVFKNRT